MGTHLVFRLTLGEASPPGARLARVVAALAANEQIEDESWALRPPYSSSIRNRLAAAGPGRSKKPEELPYGDRLATHAVRRLLGQRPEDVDALVVDGITRLWLQASSGKPETVEIDLAEPGMKLFQEPREHPWFERRREQLQSHLAAAEEGHEHWKIQGLRDALRELPDTIVAEAIEFTFALVESLTSLVDPVLMLVGPDERGMAVSSARIAYFRDVEAARDALRADFTRPELIRVGDRALARAIEAQGPWVMELATGFLLANPDLNPTGPPLAEFFEGLLGR